MDEFEEEIQKLIDKKQYDNALNLVEEKLEEMSNDGDWQIALHELAARILLERGCTDNTLIWSHLNYAKKGGPEAENDEYCFYFTETAFVHGTLLRRKGILIDSLQTLRAGVNEIPKTERQKVAKFSALIEEIEEEQKQASVKLGNELLEDEERARKAASKACGGKKAKANQKKRNKNKKKKSNAQDTGEGERSELQDDGRRTEALKKAVEPVADIQFDVKYKVNLDKKSGHNSYIGSVGSSFKEERLEKSFVEASDSQVSQLKHLVDACSRHESLLTCEGLFVSPVDNKKLLVTEAVFSLDYFFSEEYKLFMKKSATSVTNVEWWKHISQLFWSIFRDMARGLMFLFKGDMFCEELPFNTFVTPGGRGKLLPTMNPSSNRRQQQQKDVKDLRSEMRRVIYLNFPDKEDTHFLPDELIHFLKFPKPEDLQVPSIVWIDHVYFLSVGERVDFALKLKKLLKDEKVLISEINLKLRELHFFDGWAGRVSGNENGVYHQIWKKGDTKEVQQYRDNWCISRFVGSVYAHANAKGHRKERGQNQKKLSDEELERGFRRLFPEFYTCMFECLCKCANEGTLTVAQLMEVSSTYFRDQEAKIEIESPVKKSITAKGRNSNEHPVLKATAFP